MLFLKSRSQNYNYTIMTIWQNCPSLKMCKTTVFVINQCKYNGTVVFTLPVPVSTLQDINVSQPLS